MKIRLAEVCTDHAVILQVCVDYVDHIFCFGVQTMKSVLDDCLAQFSSKYVLKEEQRQAAAKGCCGGSSY